MEAGPSRSSEMFKTSVRDVLKDILTNSDVIKAPIYNIPDLAPQITIANDMSTRPFGFNLLMKPVQISSNGRYLLVHYYKLSVPYHKHDRESMMLLDFNTLIDLIKVSPTSMNEWMNKAIIKYDKKQTYSYGVFLDNDHLFITSGDININDRIGLIVKLVNVTTQIYRISTGRLYNIQLNISPIQPVQTTYYNIPIKQGSYLIFSDKYYKWSNETLVLKGNTSKSMDDYLVIYADNYYNNYEYREPWEPFIITGPGIFANIKSDHLISYVLNDQMMATWNNFIFPNSQHQLILSESPDKSKILFFQSPGPEEIIYINSFALAYNKARIVPVKFKGEYNTYSWTQNNDLLMVQYDEVLKTIKFDLYTFSNGGIKVWALITLNIGNIVNKYGPTVFHILSSTSSHNIRESSPIFAINMINNNIWLAYTYSNDYNSYPESISIAFDYTNVNNMFIMKSSQGSIPHNNPSLSIVQPGIIYYTNTKIEPFEIFDINLNPLSLNIPSNTNILFDLENMSFRQLSDNDTMLPFVVSKNKLRLVFYGEEFLSVIDTKVGNLLNLGVDIKTPLITIDEYVKLNIRLKYSRELAQEAQEISQALIMQPGGAIVSKMAAGTIARLGPTETTQYIIPAYQKLYNACSNPEGVSKETILNIAQEIGYINIDELIVLSNSQICSMLTNFAQIQLGGRSPI